MSDISMCKDETCPSRKKCHRYTAIACNDMQTYAAFDRQDKDKCEYFWPDEGYLKYEEHLK